MLGWCHNNGNPFPSHPCACYMAVISRVNGPLLGRLTADSVSSSTVHLRVTYFERVVRQLTARRLDGHGEPRNGRLWRMRQAARLHAPLAPSSCLRRDREPIGGGNRIKKQCPEWGDSGPQSTRGRGASVKGTHTQADLHHGLLSRFSPSGPPLSVGCQCSITSGDP